MNRSGSDLLSPVLRRFAFACLMDEPCPARTCKRKWRVSRVGEAGTDLRQESVKTRFEVVSAVGIEPTTY